MNSLKKILGWVWLVAGPAFILFLVKGAIDNIDLNGKKEINDPVIWIIILLIFLPIAIGFVIFGWYAIKGEYNHLPESSEELK
jgi:hypothetical protein